VSRNLLIVYLKEGVKGGRGLLYKRVRLRLARGINLQTFSERIDKRITAFTCKGWDFFRSVDKISEKGVFF